MPEPRSKPGEDVQTCFALLAMGSTWLRCSWQPSVKASMVLPVFPVERELAVFCNPSKDSVSCGQIWRRGSENGGGGSCFSIWKWVLLSSESVYGGRSSMADVVQSPKTLLIVWNECASSFFVGC